MNVTVSPIIFTLMGKVYWNSFNFQLLSKKFHFIYLKKIKLLGSWRVKTIQNPQIDSRMYKVSAVNSSVSGIDSMPSPMWFMMWGVAVVKSVLTTASHRTNHVLYDGLIAILKTSSSFMLLCKPVGPIKSGYRWS